MFESPTPNTEALLPIFEDAEVGKLLLDSKVRTDLNTKDTNKAPTRPETAVPAILSLKHLEQGGAPRRRRRYYRRKVALVNLISDERQM